MVSAIIHFLLDDIFLGFCSKLFGKVAGSHLPNLKGVPSKSGKKVEQEVVKIEKRIALFKKVLQSKFFVFSG